MPDLQGSEPRRSVLGHASAEMHSVPELRTPKRRFVRDVRLGSCLSPLLRIPLRRLQTLSQLISYLGLEHQDVQLRVPGNYRIYLRTVHWVL